MFLISDSLNDNVFAINLSFNATAFGQNVNLGLWVAMLFIFAGLLHLFLFSTNLLVTLLFAELMFVGFFIGFVVAAVQLGDPAGLGFGLYLLCSAAVDSAIGLILILNTFKLHKSVSFDRLVTLRG